MVGVEIIAELEMSGCEVLVSGNVIPVSQVTFAVELRRRLA